MKTTIRLIVSPLALLMFLIPFIFAAFRATFFFVRYGGEFMAYTKEEKVTIHSIYQQLKDKQ